MSPPVRPATAADLPEILRVVNLAYVVEAFFKTGDRLTPDELAARFDDPCATFLVRDAAPGRLAASVAFEVRGDRGWFGLLAVDPAEQGRGHARALIDAMEARCRRLGLRGLDLSIVDLREELPAFYGRFGFAVTGRAPFPHAEKISRPVEYILMGKELP